MSDKLVLIVLQILSEYGVYGYGLTIGKIETPEVLAYYKTCLSDTTDLYQSITEIIHRKGYQHQPVYIPTVQQAEFVENPSFLAGWWGEQRQVSAIEIDSLIFSLRGAMLAKTMFMVLSEIAKDPKVQKVCKRGKEITGKRVERIQSLNTAENLPFQATYESEITDTTISPFSDRLIMFETLSLSEIAIARYGNALSTVVRRDLSSMLALYIVETGTYLDDVLSLMIEKNWFEQPPMAANRK
jgi:spore coat protein CotF